MDAEWFWQYVWYISRSSQMLNVNKQLGGAGVSSSHSARISKIKFICRFKKTSLPSSFPPSKPRWQLNLSALPDWTSRILRIIALLSAGGLRRCSCGEALAPSAEEKRGESMPRNLMHVVSFRVSQQLYYNTRAIRTLGSWQTSHRCNSWRLSDWLLFEKHLKLNF